MIAYFDTSALVKLVLEESGSEIATTLWSRADMNATCLIAYAEAHAAIAAAARRGRITARQHQMALDDLEPLFAETHLMGVTSALMRSAGALSRLHALRAYDAVHLAAATAIGGDEMTMATWDEQLADAAEAEGLVVNARYT